MRGADLDIALSKPVTETDNAKSNENIVFYYFNKCIIERYYGKIPCNNIICIEYTKNIFSWLLQSIFFKLN